MKANQVFQPSKKLILHFDIDGVIRLPVRKNKDLYVGLGLCRYMICVRIGCGGDSKKIVKKIQIWSLAGN